MLEVIISSCISSALSGVITALVLFRFIDKRLPKKPGRKPKEQTKKKAHASAKNSIQSPTVDTQNATVDFQKIKTAEIEIPVIAEDVLTYEAGELGSSYPDKTRLYYPADAISDPEYLETVMRSPLQVQTHQKNTSEYNRDVDGWPTKVWWDPAEKRVKLKGILHGEENVEYARENKSLPGFGTSAFISFLKIEKESGTAPDGKPYDAIVRKAVNNHVAILPNVRDPKNVILAMNAVENCVDVTNPSWVQDDATWERAKKQADKGNYPKEKYYAVVTDIYKKMGGSIAHGGNSKMEIDKAAIRDVINEMRREEEKEKGFEDRIANAVAEKLMSSSSGSSSTGTGTSTGTSRNAETSTSTGTTTGTAGNGSESSGTESSKKDPGEEASTGTGTETGTGKETATASNALPSEEMIKDFSTHMGVTFKSTPSLGELASLVGIKATEPHELITALNAKRDEFKSRKPAEAMNSKASLQELMDQI